jgi:hypothetical protein
MSAASRFLPMHRETLVSSRAAWVAGQLGLALTAFYLLKDLYTSRMSEDPGASLVAMGAALAIGFAGMRVTYKGVAPALSLLLRGITIVVGGYTLLAGIVIPPGLAEPFETIRVASPFVFAVVFLATVAAIWRPSFVLLPNVAALATKAVSAQALGLRPLSPTDYMPLVEIAAFAAIVILTWHACAPLRRAAPATVRSDAGLREVTSVAFLVSLGVHFANYFYSGWIKVTLDGAAPWTWAVENPTAILAEIATIGGFAPLAHWPAINEAMISGLWHFQQASNWIVLVTQLAAVAVIVSQRLSLLTIIFYDLLHVLIFLASGILFWKWILLNTVLVLCIRKISSEYFSRFAVVSVCVVLLAPTVFFVARLGWYDTEAFNRHVIWAVMEDGRQIEVPSNYFAITSISVAQNRIGETGAYGFPTRTWGTTQSNEVRLGARAECTFDAADAEPRRQAREEARVETFLRRMHAFRATTLDENGHVAYDIYPHHIWSNLFSFDAFAEADKREIVAYIYGIEQVCLLRDEDGMRIVRSPPSNYLRVDVIDRPEAKDPPRQ